MTTDYTIDISKNILQESKLLRITEKVYMYGFLFVGCFYVIYTLIKQESWEHYQIGLMAFLLFAIRYLQTNGLWIYKKYFTINADGIKWQKTIFVKGNLKWQDIKSIEIDFPSIDFEANSNKSKSFSLINITAQQIEILKEILGKMSDEKGIMFKAA